MVDENKRTRRADIRLVADKAPGKRCPSSLVLTTLAIQQFWLQQTGVVAKTSPPLSRKKFFSSGSFRDTFLKTINLYRAIKRPAKKDVSGVFADMTTGATEMEYFKLRALAHYTSLRSVGLLLIFTQLVGEERRSHDDKRDAKEACIQILDGVLRVVTAAKEYLLRKRPDDDLFMKKYDRTRHGYLPDVAVLKSWCDAYNAGDLPPDPIN